MDEVAVIFDIPSTRNRDLKRKKEIILSTTGEEKLNFTVVLCYMANGDRCKPMVIFKIKTMPKDSFPKGINIAVAPKGWMNETIMSKWNDKVWRKRKNLLSIRGTQLLYMTLIDRI